MNSIQNNATERHGPSSGRLFSWRGLIIWIPGSVLLGTLTAWAAVDLQYQLHFAPFLIFPLLVGVVLGAMLVLLMRVGQVGHRPTILLGTAIAAFLAVAGQHYFGYLADKREGHQIKMPGESKETLQKVAALLPPPPENFAEFMRQQAGKGRSIFNLIDARDGGAWILWLIEGLLTVFAAFFVVIPAMRLPFCPRCRSWYRATRSARFSAPITQRIARTLDVETGDRIRSGRCRLLSCQSGCSPTGCELSWEDLDGNTFFAQIWLDTAARNAVVQVFDEALSQEETKNVE
jgi:hypothetical protein